MVAGWGLRLGGLQISVILVLVGVHFRNSGWQTEFSPKYVRVFLQTDAPIKLMIFMKSQELVQTSSSATLQMSKNEVLSAARGRLQPAYCDFQICHLLSTPTGRRDSVEFSNVLST